LYKTWIKDIQWLNHGYLENSDNFLDSDCIKQRYPNCYPKRYPMDSSTNFQAPPQAAYFLWSCDKVYHKQEVCFLLYFLGQIVSWQYNPNLLDKNRPCTVINDHDWQLWNCRLHKMLDNRALRGRLNEISRILTRSIDSTHPYLHAEIEDWSTIKY